MKRIDIPEIHEQSWFPGFLRDGVTDALQFVLNATRVYRPVSSRLAAALTAARSDRLVDLCSGGGGPWIWLHRSLSESDLGPVSICLTDKYPNVAAFRRAHAASRGAIGYCSESLDAENVPSRLSGFRTLFTSFHHFSSDQGRRILQDAVDSRQGIGIFEAPRRHPLGLLLAFFMPIAALVAVPFIRPFRFSLLLWTYLIPVIPFVLWFDGVLSCLRAYSPGELLDLISCLGPNHYRWEVGEKFGGIATVTYLLGYPADIDRRPASFLPRSEKEAPVLPTS